jgi:hypothetical protein
MKMTRIALAAALAFAGNAVAGEGLIVQSEAQFARDNSADIQTVAPGVYRFNAGEFVGKTVSIGDAGLAYDLQLHRNRIANAKGKAAGASDTIVRALEQVSREQNERKPAGEVQTRASNSGSLTCNVYNYATNQYISFSGYAFVNADAELYLSNGGGGFNYYYARAYSDATGEVFKPSNAPNSLYLRAGAVAENRLTGQVISRVRSGYTSVDVEAGPVYSGPEFSHDLYAFSYVSGRAGCSGYVSVSDTDWLN